MKKQVVCTLAAALAVTSLSAFAANPFVDVPSDSWAYQSVVELADAGIIQGVDGQYFQGNRNITRYEAAEMVAKAMAHMDKASVEQRALINKLADEYADELNSLGVRVTNLENRVGNTRVFGDAFCPLPLPERQQERRQFLGYALPHPRPGPGQRPHQGHGRRQHGLPPLRQQRRSV